NLRHNAEYQQSGATASVMEGLFVIRYFIVELSLIELGVLNASRR
ncbi:hypothetical protein LCGC14_2039880, partial [marine sediment metagenome]